MWALVLPQGCVGLDGLWAYGLMPTDSHRHGLCARDWFIQCDCAQCRQNHGVPDPTVDVVSGCNLAPHHREQEVIHALLFYVMLVLSERHNSGQGTNLVLDLPLLWKQ